jgi:hypothetical protein
MADTPADKTVSKGLRFIASMTAFDAAALTVAPDVGQMLWIRSDPRRAANVMRQAES